MYLSKSDFLEYLRCSKNLWLKKNRPDLYVQSEASDFQEAKLEEGVEVEHLARQMFAGGITIEGGPEEAAARTQELLGQRASPLFQATAITENGLLAKADVLKLNESTDRWDILEVKSSISVKKDRAHNHIKDVTFQKLAFEGAGLKVGSASIVHLNKDYRRSGDIDVSELFVVADVSQEVQEIRDETAAEVQLALATIGTAEVDISSCACLYSTRSNHCSSFGVLNPGVPDYSVHDIPRIRAEKLRTLIDHGVLAITDVPDSFELTDNQRQHVELARSGAPSIDLGAIIGTLEKLTYPLYFFDYETYCGAIPILDGYGPYEHIPFQVSIHRLDQDGSLEHYERLGSSIEQVPFDIIEFVKDSIGGSGMAVSWHASFENGINKHMAEIYPDSASFLHDLVQRTFDLETLFKKDYLHPEFRGRSSIKIVLPALIPGFSYKNLDIQGGTEAMENWRSLVFDQLSDAEKTSIQNALLGYCAMDTKAMVEIYKHLQGLGEN